jgi:hypothetical protein
MTMLASPQRMRLGRQVGGLEAAAADHVDGVGGHRGRQAGLDDGLARRVLADAGGQHLAQNDFADRGRVDAGFRQQAADHLRAEFGGRNLGERTAEFADGGDGLRLSRLTTSSMPFHQSLGCANGVDRVCMVVPFRNKRNGRRGV